MWLVNGKPFIFEVGQVSANNIVINDLLSPYLSSCKQGFQVTSCLCDIVDVRTKYGQTKEITNRTTYLLVAVRSAAVVFTAARHAEDMM